MKKNIEIKDGMIPVQSKEATVIIGKLFDKAILTFDKCKVNMNLNRSVTKIEQ